MKMFDSELKIMEIIWDNEPVPAKEISRIAAETIGWNKNTTYTVIKKLIDKQAVKRTEPHFLCTSLVKKEELQKSEIKRLIDGFYGGSRKAFFSAFSGESLTDEEVEELKALIEKRK